MTEALRPLHSDVQTSNTPALRNELVALVNASPWLVAALGAANQCMCAPWCIAAGAVRSLVWDHLHELENGEPADLDLVFFDPAVSSAEDARLTTTLLQHTAFRWEVVNQAHVHLWSVPPDAPFPSLEHAIAAWPETATAVGITLDANEQVQVIAPLGLDDLFGMTVRPSPFLRHPEAFETRRTSKHFQRRWPKVRYVMDVR